MRDEADLLRRYVAGDDTAFAELVQRRIDFVHSCALRQVNGDAHLAADVAQLVFSDLAKKARALACRPVLAGWLFTSTRYAAAKLVRGEQRRRAREQKAQLMHELNDEPSGALDWERVRPVLDDALASLNESDRAAILLRFFEGRDFADIGARLALNANTARMRVDRAVEKLHALLARRGVTSTTSALALALGSQAMAAAPAGLAASVAGSAVAAGATGGTAGGLLALMGMTKAQLGIAVALAVGGGAIWIVQADANAEAKREVAALRKEEIGRNALEAENRELARRIAEAEEMRGDDAALAQLQEEAAKLHGRLELLTRREAEIAQQRREKAASAAAAGFQLAQTDRPPQPMHQTRPVYPVELKAQGIGGEVLVEFTVDAEGVVREPRAVKATHPAFSAPAVEALSQWRFDPGLKGGRKVNTRMTVPVVFSSNQEAAKGAMETSPVGGSNLFGR